MVKVKNLPQPRRYLAWAVGIAVVVGRSIVVDVGAWKPGLAVLAHVESHAGETVC